MNPDPKRRRLLLAGVAGLLASGHAIETHPGLAPGHPPITQDHPLWALFMGFEHERIHLETSAVLIHELPLNLVQRPAEWPRLHPSAGRSVASFPPRFGRDYPANALVSVPGQPVTLGKPADWPSFGWDNEYGRRETTVQPFQASRQLVSNGEFLRAEGFELLREADEPLVIREHARKYQYIVAHATLWRRVE